MAEAVGPLSEPVRTLPPPRGRRGLNDAAGKAGNVIGIAVERVRAVPQRVGELKTRLTVVRGRAREGAARTAGELQEQARRRLREARSQARLWAQENPLAFIAGAAGVGFLAGVALRIWRSNARR